MNDRFRALTGVSLAAAFVLVAGNGKAFGEALLSFPVLVSAWSAVLPAGTWSAVLAMLVATGTWSFCMRWLPPGRGGHPPDFASHVIAILIAIAVTVGQVTLGSPGPAEPGVLLQALWMGIAAGFMAPLAGLAMRSVIARPGEGPHA